MCGFEIQAFELKLILNIDKCINTLDIIICIGIYIYISCIFLKKTNINKISTVYILKQRNIIKFILNHV